MARKVHDREDLLRDASALLPRIQLRRDGGDEVFAGFRGDCLSLYFNNDPVLHFNAAGELRRAYSGGRMIKAERRTLVSLLRVQSPDRSNLVRTEWKARQTREFLAEVDRRLTQLEAALSAAEYLMVGQVPADGDALGRLQQWLARRTAITIAASSPRVR